MKLARHPNKRWLSLADFYCTRRDETIACADDLITTDLFESSGDTKNGIFIVDQQKFVPD